jgi:5-methylthioadenosine/S-adenosylhomocysteine deaminase
MANGSANSHLIRGARVLDAMAHAAPLLDVLVVNGVVAAIGADLAAPDGVSVVDAADRMLIPGLVNAHTHAHGALSKGLGDRWALEHLLNAGRWMNSGLLLEDKYLSAQLNAAELVRKGCTAVYDLIAEFPLPTAEGIDAVARAYNDVGMRAVVAPMVADRTLFESIPGLLETLPEALRAELTPVRASPVEAIAAACRKAFAAWPYDRDWIRPALAPSIPLHCTPEFLATCVRLSCDFDIGLHTHLAESRVQALAGMERYGQTITAYLESVGFLGPKVVAAHCIWLDDDDIGRLSNNGCAVVHNPGSNLRLGSGIAPVREMLRRGLTVGLGTDGSSCSDHQNMFEAMRMASLVSRVRPSHVDDWIGTEEVVQMATSGGAKALGMPARAPGLTVGAQADIVFLDLGSLNFIPFNDPTNQLVHSENGDAVDSVMIGGKWVLRYGRFETIDIGRLRSRVEASVERLRAGWRDTKPLAERLTGYVSSFCTGAQQRPYHVSRCCRQGPGFSCVEDGN